MEDKYTTKSGSLDVNDPRAMFTASYEGLNAVGYERVEINRATSVREDILALEPSIVTLCPYMDYSSLDDKFVSLPPYMDYSSLDDKLVSLPPYMDYSSLDNKLLTKDEQSGMQQVCMTYKTLDNSEFHSKPLITSKRK